MKDCRDIKLFKYGVTVNIRIVPVSKEGLFNTFYDRQIIGYIMYLTFNNTQTGTMGNYHVHNLQLQSTTFVYQNIRKQLNERIRYILYMVKHGDNITMNHGLFTTCICLFEARLISVPTICITVLRNFKTDKL